MRKVAVVGLGAIGGRIAARLLETGHEVTVWNRTAAKAEPLVAAGASLAGSPSEAAAGAEAVVTCLADPDALLHVVAGPDGIARGIGDGTLIEMSTVGPAAIDRLAAELPALSGTSPGRAGAGGVLPASLQDGFAAAMGQSLLLPAAVLVVGWVAALCFARPHHLRRPSPEDAAVSV